VVVRARTKIELRNLRGDIFPIGTEVTIIEEAEAAGARAYFVEIPVVDGINSVGVRYAGFMVKEQDLEPIE